MNERGRETAQKHNAFVDTVGTDAIKIYVSSNYIKNLLLLVFV